MSSPNPQKEKQSLEPDLKGEFIKKLYNSIRNDPLLGKRMRFNEVVYGKRGNFTGRPLSSQKIL